MTHSQSSTTSSAVVSDAVLEAIRETITSNDVVLYIKGTPQMPHCGFSGGVIKILDRLQIAYASVNVLDNSEIREGIKAYTNWPTIPQLYIKGEFIGGYDIVRDLYKSGELQALLEEQGIPFSKEANA